MPGLIEALIVAVIVCAVIWFVTYLLVRYVLPAEMARWAYLMAILLIALVLLRVIWPYV